MYKLSPNESSFLIYTSTHYLLGLRRRTLIVMSKEECYRQIQGPRGEYLLNELVTWDFFKDFLGAMKVSYWLKIKLEKGKEEGTL